MGYQIQLADHHLCCYKQPDHCMSDVQLLDLRLQGHTGGIEKGQVNRNFLTSEINPVIDQYFKYF